MQLREVRIDTIGYGKGLHSIILFSSKWILQTASLCKIILVLL